MRHPLQPRPARHHSTTTVPERAASRHRRSLAVVLGVGVGSAAALGGAGLSVQASESSTTYTIGLDTAEADPGEDCPAGPGAFWHFVLAPNGKGNFAFTGMVLDLAGEAISVEADDLLPNGQQWDNVFVAVPAGRSLDDLRTTMSTASYTSLDGDQAMRWNLSHTCPGEVLDEEIDEEVDEEVVVIDESDPSVPTEVVETVPTTSVVTTTTATTEPPAPTTSTTSTTTTTVAPSPTTATVAAAGPVPASAASAASATAASAAAASAASAASSAGGTLPTTGGAPLPVAQVACWAVVVGCCLIALHRRRRVATR